MAQIIDLLSWAALLGGSFFYVVGAIGLIRMPDIFTRMHAVSVSESLGIGLMIIGMVLQAGLTLVAVKLGIIMVVMMWTGSVATHALARAALHDGEEPLLTDQTGALVRTDPTSLFPELGARLAAPLKSEIVEEIPAETRHGDEAEPAERVDLGSESLDASPDYDDPDTAPDSGSDSKHRDDR